jgi:hypothetical protein
MLNWRPMLPGDLRAHLERDQGQQQRHETDHAGGGDLAADDRAARARRGQQGSSDCRSRSPAVASITR